VHLLPLSPRRQLQNVHQAVSPDTGKHLANSTVRSLKRSIAPPPQDFVLMHEQRGITASHPTNFPQCQRPSLFNFHRPVELRPQPSYTFP